MGMTPEERRAYDRRKQREYRERDPEKYRARRRAHYARNRDRIREQQQSPEQREYKRLWYEANRERQLQLGRERYQRNREGMLARSREHYAANREWYLAYQREYYAKNRADWRKRYEENREEKLAAARLRRRQNLEKYRQQDRESRIKNRDKILERGRIARLRKNHGLWPEDLVAIWEEQGGLCYLCGEEITDRAAIDHDHSCCPEDHSCRICRRGLAHANCNTAIGFAGDDPEMLRTMADALEAAKLAFEGRRAAAEVSVPLFLIE